MRTLCEYKHMYTHKCNTCKLYTHTHTPCVRIRKHQYLHTHVKHIRKQDTNTDMYACICMYTLCMHTQCLFIHICIDVHTYTHTYKPRCAYICACTHIASVCTHSVPSHTYIHTYIHPYTHAQKQTCMYSFTRTSAYI